MPKKIFDEFTFEARVMPAVTIVLPVLATGAYKGVIDNKWTETSVEFALAIVALVFMTYVVREFGKTYEKKMIGNLAALPTTIVMRFSDNRIDEISKVKYHKWFNNKGEKYHLPLSLAEEQEDTQSDNKYINAMKDLRVYAYNHRPMYPRVYQELKKYNYWRNLYGCKKIAMVLYTLMAIKEFVQLKEFNAKEMLVAYDPQYNVLFGVLLWAIFFCIAVTKKVVERNAFDYAVTLIETICDTDIT